MQLLKLTVSGFSLALFLSLLLSACGSDPGNGNAESADPGSRQAKPTKAEIESAFQKEWEAWKLSKYNELSQEQRDQLQMRGVGNPRDIVDQSLEKQAESWMGDLKREFAARYDGYQKLVQRLVDEHHPNPQDERTAWFGALVSEVSK